MIQCNGVSLKNIELKKFRIRNNFYYDNIASLDIEVTTGFLHGEEVEAFDIYKKAEYYSEMESISLLYLWNICIDGYLFSGRSYTDLLSFLESLDSMLEGTFYIFIHNASYEFQFLRNILQEVDMFARQMRKPLKFTWRNLEFRCSYMLTRLSLDTWANEKNLSVKKLTGKYDYSLLRTPYTFLSTLERDYGYNDVLVVVEGLQEYLERYGHVKDIPLTQTSCIRKEVVKVMKSDNKAHRLVRDMTDISLENYQFLIDCFSGGYTHANVLFANRVIENVWDFDISSSYPWAMISEKFPVTPFIKSTSYKRYMIRNDLYCYMCEVEFTNIESRYFNTYISASKCIDLQNAVLDNGRVLSADSLRIRILDVDYDIIRKAYKYDKEDIKEFYYAKKDYLPDVFRRYIIELYKHKTSLKNVQDKYALYFKSKEEINGIYGMSVTKDITDEIVFDIIKGWSKDILTSEKYYDKVSKKCRNFSKLNMSYSQGIFVPAFGRKNLWYMVHKFDDLIVYMDTDSIKVAPPHDGVLDIIDVYNNFVYETQIKIASDLNLTIDDLNPRDSKGNIHSIGKYERDEDIIKFKTLGAKRYICQYDEQKYAENYLKMTVAGVRKKAVKQLCGIDDFSEDLVFTTENAQKLLLKYRDDQPPVVWKRGDYDEWTSTECYGISSYNIPYHMSVTTDYLALIRRKYEEQTKIFRRE